MTDRAVGWRSPRHGGACGRIRSKENGYYRVEIEGKGGSEPAFLKCRKEALEVIPRTAQPAKRQPKRPKLEKEDTIHKILRGRAQAEDEEEQSEAEEEEEDEEEDDEEGREEGSEEDEDEESEEDEGEEEEEEEEEEVAGAEELASRGEASDAGHEEEPDASAWRWYDPAFP